MKTVKELMPAGKTLIGMAELETELEIDRRSLNRYAVRNELGFMAGRTRLLNRKEVGVLLKELKRRFRSRPRIDSYETTT